jgi:hypothetical protein
VLTGKKGFSVAIDRSFFFGALYSKTFTDETMTGSYAGDIHRSNFLFDFGYAFVPDTFYLRGMFGFSTVNSSNLMIGTRVEPTIGAGLGYTFFKNGDSSSIGVEATYEYTERAVSSALGVDTDFDEAEGDFDVSSIVPHASVFALNLVFSLTP